MNPRQSRLGVSTVTFIIVLNLFLDCDTELQFFLAYSVRRGTLSEGRGEMTDVISLTGKAQLEHCIPSVDWAVLE